MKDARATAGAWGSVTGRTWLLGCALILAIALVYVPSYRADFIWDDDDYLLLNPLVTEPGGMAQIWNPTSSLNPQYYPLVFTLFRWEYRLWGLNPLGYHVVNVMLHAMAALMLLMLLTRVRAPAAWLAAALFALHPVCVESVAWVTECKNVLAALLSFLAALAFLRHDEHGRWPWLLATLLVFQLALLSKTAALALPIGLGLVLWWRGRLRPRRLLVLLVMIVQSIAMGLITRSHEYEHMLVEGGGSYFQQLDFADRLLTAGRAFWFYPAKLVWPVDLVFFYSHWQVSPAIWWQWLFPAGVLLVAAALFYMVRRGTLGRGTLVAIGYYAAAIFPVLGFINIVFTRYAQVADHFQYLPSIGILVLVAGLWNRLAGNAPGPLWRAPRRLSATAFALVILILLAVLSHRHARNFRDLDTLWTYCYEKSPDNWVVQINHGVQLKQRGDLAGAAACYERAVVLSPAPSEAAILGYGNLASVRFTQKRYGESLRAAEACLAIKPDYPLARYNRGRTLWRLGRLAEAEEVLDDLLSTTIAPAAGRAAWDLHRRLDEARAWYVLAQVRIALGKQDAALASFDRALAVTPAEKHLHDAKLRTLLRWHRYGAAIAAARRAVRLLIDPVPYEMQLALLLSVAPDSTDRDGEEALAIAGSLIRRMGGSNPALLSIQAAAQAEQGFFPEAVATVQRAQSLIEGADQTGLSKQLQDQLAAFSAGELILYTP